MQRNKFKELNIIQPEREFCHQNRTQKHSFDHYLQQVYDHNFYLLQYQLVPVIELLVI